MHYNFQKEIKIKKGAKPLYPYTIVTFKNIYSLFCSILVYKTRLYRL